MIDALFTLGAIIVAALLAWFARGRSAKAAHKLDAAKEKADALETRNEVDNRIARERNSRERLRGEWGE